MKRACWSVCFAAVMLGIGVRVGYGASLGPHPTAIWQQLLERHAGWLAEERHVEAALLAEGAVRLAEHVFGPESIEYAQSAGHLASDYLVVGRVDQARDLYAQSTALKTTLLEPTDPIVTLALVHESQYHLARGRPDHAEPLLRHALANQPIRENNSAVRLHVLILLANTFMALNRPQEAEALYLDEFALRERTLGAQHASVATIQLVLGSHYFDRGRMDEAQRLYQQALATRELARNEKDLMTATTLLLMEKLYATTGATLEAEQSYERATEIISRSLRGAIQGPVDQRPTRASTQRPDRTRQIHPQTVQTNDIVDMAGSLRRQAVAYENAGDYPQAISLFEQSLQAYEKALGPKDPRLLTVLEDLASLLRQLGQSRRADTITVRANKIRDTQTTTAP